MTARQRTAGAADTALPPKPVPLPWEEWFRAASAEQQKEILALARRQGLVYVHQTPLPANGAAKDHPPEESFLARLLAGHVSALPPVQPQPIEDGDLDEAQREAVARALATPDVFLLEGLPGSGKTRVTAEIIRRACRLGRRVLFVAARSCSLDAVLGALSGCPETLAVRRTGPEEVGAQLPPAVQALTLPHLGPAFRAHIAQTAAALAARPEYHNGDGQETAERLQPALAACLEHEEQARQLEAKIATVPQRVRAESAQAGTALAARVLETRSRFEERRRALEQERQTARANAAQAGARREALQPQLAALRPLAEARRTGRWWSGAWWKAVFRGDVAARMAELEEQERQAGADLAAAEQAGHALDARRAETENEEAACVERLIQAESDRQGAEIEEALRRVRAALAEARERWHAMLAELGLAAQEPSEEGLGQARQEWTRRQDRLQARRQFNRDWAAFLHGSADELVRRLPDLANLIAAPLDGFDLHPEARRFDLLILEDAHLVTETDLLRLSRAANHWVLIADHQPDTLPLGKKDSPVRLGEANVLRSRCFHKLWQHLHGDLTRSPYAWRREQGRLCCHLRAVRPEEQSRLEIERLADFPEVELRILPTPQPALAQIVFPPQMTMAQAKQFIFRELQEVAVQRLGRTAWVREEPDRFVCRLVPWVEQPGGEPIELEKGVREWADESHSDHIEFERGAGWTRAQAELWLQQHLRLRDSGRTMFLGVSYRSQGPLARIVGDVLFPDLLLCAHGPDTTAEAPLVFHPIPCPPRDNGRKTEDKRHAAAPLWPREGAGLEIDLTAIRPVDRIPPDLRNVLPRRGFANYFEAQALVKRLESLAGSGNGATLDDVAIVALYEGQVELIAKLIERSETLQGRTFPLGLPEKFRQSEYNTVLLSLTRSHSHRAVAFGEHPQDLALALTRARRRLYLFADPGNLIKRAGWQGPLEHLDAAAAALEGQRIAQLARYLQGQGRWQDGFRAERS